MSGLFGEMSRVVSFDSNTLERRMALPIAAGATILAASPVALMFFVQNRTPIVLLAVFTSIGMFVFSEYLDEFLIPDPDSVGTPGSRKRRLVGAMLWSSVAGAFFSRMVYEPGAAHWSALAFLSGFGGAMLFAILWVLDPADFLGSVAEMMDNPITIKRIRSSTAREEQETDERNRFRRWLENAKERRRETVRIGRVYAEEERELAITGLGNRSGKA